MAIVIREIKQEDKSELARIVRVVFDEFGAPRAGTVYSDPTTDDLFNLFREERSVLWVAEVDGIAMGCCGVYPTKGLPTNCAELVKFYVLKEARGLGIGKALFEQSIESARELGYTELYLESLPHFAKAVDLYYGYGFEDLDGAIGDSGHSAPTIWMLKKL